jgi:type II secretory pathway pseudopilin PulG
MLRRWFSLIELLVMISALAVIASLLQPSITKMVGKAQQVQCATKMKWLLNAFDQYCEDYGEYPYADNNYLSWVNYGNSPSHLSSGTIWPYLNDRDVFLCPSDESGHIRSYSVSMLVNNYSKRKPFGIDLFLNSNSTPSPTQTMIFIEEHDPRYYNMGSYLPGSWGFWIDNVAGWHNVGNNFGLMDGHVEYIEWLDKETPNRFLKRDNYRKHQDMVRILKYFTAGIIKP